MLVSLLLFETGGWFYRSICCYLDFKYDVIFIRFISMDEINAEILSCLYNTLVLVTREQENQMRIGKAFDSRLN